MGNEGPFQDPSGPFGTPKDPFGAPEGQRHAHDRPKEQEAPAPTSDLADMPGPVTGPPTRSRGPGIGLVIGVIALLLIGGIGAAIFFAVRTVDRAMSPFDDLPSAIADIPGFDMPDFEMPEFDDLPEAPVPGEVWSPPSPEAQALFLSTLRQRLPKNGNLASAPDAALVQIGISYCQAAAFGAGNTLMESLKQSDLGTPKDWQRFERTVLQELC